jgi:hypothetical protein
VSDKQRRDPHPIFVIVLVGEDEQPFGIQKDFLCAKSSFYRDYFSKSEQAESIEHIVRLPSTSIEIFSYAQNFLFTGKVFHTVETMPSYEMCVGVWKLGNELDIEGLCDATLEAMTECRQLTEHIPAAPLLVQVWQDTPEGSSIRKLLLSWAAEYMRSSESRAEFARSLPQEVLSELVVTMSSLDASPPVQAPTAPPYASGPRKNVHYLDTEETGEGGQIVKKQRHSDILPNGGTPHAPVRSALPKKPARSSLPAKSAGRKRDLAGDASMFSTNQKLNFCADLLARMLSGPGSPVPCSSVKMTDTLLGFWTRLVGPFKEPVDPVPDGVPDYLNKVQRPMDLSTMKLKMDRKEYTDEEAFLADMRQIFTNCYTYWSKKDPMWAACEKLEKTFEEKYGQMNKWIKKLDMGEEPA